MHGGAPSFGLMCFANVAEAHILTRSPSASSVPSSSGGEKWPTMLQPSQAHSIIDNTKGHSVHDECTNNSV